MYLKFSIQEFKAWCVNHKNELKKVKSLRMSTYRGSKSYTTLKDFGQAVLQLENDHSEVTITSIYGENFNGNAYKTADVFYDLFINGHINVIEFNAKYIKK